MNVRAAAMAAFCLLILGGATARAQTVAAASIPTSASTTPYDLGPGDQVRVTVFNEPDLSVEQQLSAEGLINLPLVGDVSATGMTTAELSQAIEARLRQGYLRNPRVSVTVLTYRPFYVVGEVNRPGAYPFSADLTIASAIATAGGFANGANRDRVYVQRAGAIEEHPRRLHDNITLQPGDTVRVGRSALAGLRDLPLGLLGLLP